MQDWAGILATSQRGSRSVDRSRKLASWTTPRVNSISCCEARQTTWRRSAASPRFTSDAARWRPHSRYYNRALALAPFDPELEENVNRIARELGRAASVTPDGLSFEEASSQLLSAASRLPEVEPHQADVQTAAPTSTADSTSESPIDYDALLASFGMPDASPSPVVERLLSEPPEPSAAAEPVLPAPVLDEPPVHSVAADPFATLEQELRSFEHRLSAAPAVLEALSEEAHVPILRTDDLVVEELEAWLRVLSDDASASPSL